MDNKAVDEALKILMSRQGKTDSEFVMQAQEAKAIRTSLGDPQFMSLLTDYMESLRDPAVLAEQNAYLRSIDPNYVDMNLGSNGMNGKNGKNATTKKGRTNSSNIGTKPKEEIVNTTTVKSKSVVKDTNRRGNNNANNTTNNSIVSATPSTSAWGGKSPVTPTNAATTSINASIVSPDIVKNTVTIISNTPNNANTNEKVAKQGPILYIRPEYTVTVDPTDPTLFTIVFHLKCVSDFNTVTLDFMNDNTLVLHTSVLDVPRELYVPHLVMSRRQQRQEKKPTNFECCTRQEENFGSEFNLVGPFRAQYSIHLLVNDCTRAKWEEASKLQSVTVIANNTSEKNIPLIGPSFLLFGQEYYDQQIYLKPVSEEERRSIYNVMEEQVQEQEEVSEVVLTTTPELPVIPELLVVPEVAATLVHNIDQNTITPCIPSPSVHTTKNKNKQRNKHNNNNNNNNNTLNTHTLNDETSVIDTPTTTTTSHSESEDTTTNNNKNNNTNKNSKKNNKKHKAPPAVVESVPVPEPEPIIDYVADAIRKQKEEEERKQLELQLKKQQEQEILEAEKRLELLELEDQGFDADTEANTDKNRTVDLLSTGVGPKTRRVKQMLEQIVSEPVVLKFPTCSMCIIDDKADTCQHAPETDPGSAVYDKKVEKLMKKTGVLPIELQRKYRVSGGDRVVLVEHWVEEVIEETTDTVMETKKTLSFSPQLAITHDNGKKGVEKLVDHEDPTFNNHVHLPVSMYAVLQHMKISQQSNAVENLSPYLVGNNAKLLGASPMFTLNTSPLLASTGITSGMDDFSLETKPKPKKMKGKHGPGVPAHTYTIYPDHVQQVLQIKDTTQQKSVLTYHNGRLQGNLMTDKNQTTSIDAVLSGVCTSMHWVVNRDNVVVTLEKKETYKFEESWVLKPWGTVAVPVLQEQEPEPEVSIVLSKKIGSIEDVTDDIVLASEDNSNSSSETLLSLTVLSNMKHGLVNTLSSFIGGNVDLTTTMSNNTQTATTATRVGRLD